MLAPMERPEELERAVAEGLEALLPRARIDVAGQHPGTLVRIVQGASASGKPYGWRRRLWDNEGRLAWGEDAESAIGELYYEYSDQGATAADDIAEEDDVLWCFDE